jgi:pimeloyl-ACP methyl ester carboxylesterase
MPPRLSTLVSTAIAVGCVAGCATSPTNPSFDLAATDARKVLREMRESPRPLGRPVVVVHGLGPPVGSWWLARELRRLTRDERVVTVSYDYLGPMSASRRSVINAVEKRFPCDDPCFTREVDVVAISMGGVVARDAAAPLPQGAARAGGKRLKIARLFTISSPHRGSAMAAALPVLLGSTQRDLRAGSAYLRELERREAGGPAYEIVPYARLGDRIVGERNAAPAGMTPIWLPNLLLEGAHLSAFSDPRIVADIARRLRGEPPLATEPSEPLPKG